MNINHKTVLLLALISLTPYTASAGKREFKSAEVYADDSAWYVGSWKGANTAFDPPLQVEITVLPTGEVYAYAHGQNKGYHVTTSNKVVKIHKLADAPMRGKVLNPKTIMLEDGGKLQIAHTADGLQTTVPKLGIVVQYQAPDNSDELDAIRQRAATQAEKAAHHKDHDFWHSEAFWGTVAAGVIVGAVVHDDHVDVHNPSISKADEAALQKAYPK